MKKILLVSATILIGLNTLSAQDSWVNNVIGGFNNTNNTQSKGLNVFNNRLYAATGPDSGYVYRTSTGQKNSWQKVFSQPGVSSVNAINSTSSNFYVSGYYNYNSIYPDTTIIYRSSDGSTNWTPYFKFSGSANFIIPFKGIGTVDSIYVIKNGVNGSEIWKNDQLNLSNSWAQTNFVNNGYFTITSNCIHNSKLYIGTSQSAPLYKPTLWSSADGNNWTQESTIILDTTQFSSTSISAMVSFNNELYIGTESYNGAQIWETTDFIAWNLVATYPNFGKITSLQVISNKLCATLQGKYIGTGIFSPAAIVRDASTYPYTYSMNNGFGVQGLDGANGSTIQFGNNIYYSCDYQFMSSPPIIRGPNSLSSGSQIWKLCLTSPPSISLGADKTICSGIPYTFDAGNSGIGYVWTDLAFNQTLDTTQTLTVSYPGSYAVTVLSANGCEVVDTVSLKNIPSPSNSGNFYDRGSLLCKGDTVQLPVTANSNLRTTGPTFQSNLKVPFSSLESVADTLMVNIAPDEWAGDAIISVTIDSIVDINNNGLQLTLKPPFGAPITLSNYAYGNNYVGTTFIRGGGPIYNGIAPYTGSFGPVDSLYNLSGSTNGIWILQLTDTYGNNYGYLKGWSLKFSQRDTVVTYSWAPTNGLLMPSNAPNLLASPQSSTTYTLTVTNQIGCSSHDSALVEIPRLQINSHLPHICFNGSDSLSASIVGLSNFGQPSPPGYHWSNNAGLNDSLAFGLTVTPINTTIYYVADTLSTGCPIQDTTVVYVSPQITADAGAVQKICLGDTALISASAIGGTSPYTYSWYDGSTTNTGQTINVSPAAATYTYSLTVTDNWACSAGSSTTLTVIQSTDIYGHVDSLGFNSITNGEVVIYKYQSYLTRFDSINAVQLDANGNYHFSNINNGTYLIEVFPNITSYQTSVPTYFGNTFLWTTASTISHDCSVNDTANISAIFTLPNSGPGSLGGIIREGFGFVARQEGDPIPGLDVKLGKNPGGQIMASTQTDGNGYYSFGNLALNTEYVIYADVPGLGRDSSYTITLDATNPSFDSLNYLVDSTTIYIVPTSSTGINNIASDVTSHFSIYPNPFKGNTSIEYNISKESDVTIEVINVLGVKIKSLVNSRQLAGNHKFNLNNQNIQLSSGVYFITLNIDGKESTQRIVVIE